MWAGLDGAMIIKCTYLRCVPAWPAACWNIVLGMVMGSSKQEINRRDNVASRARRMHARTHACSGAPPVAPVHTCSNMPAPPHLACRAAP